MGDKLFCELTSPFSPALVILVMLKPTTTKQGTSSPTSSERKRLSNNMGKLVFIVFASKLFFI
jgi:hypothetical protein